MKTAIEMAREAGFHKWYTMPEEHPEHVAIIERFAALVRAAEREACAVLLDANAMACHSPIYRSLLQSNADAIRARNQDPMPLFDDWNKDWK